MTDKEPLEPGRSFEIVEIDAKRWALFNLLPGFLAGLTMMIWFFSAQRGRVRFDDILGGILLILLGVTVATVVVAWIQALIFNLYVRLIRKAPIFTVREVVDSRVPTSPAEKSNVADRLREHAAKVKASRQEFPKSKEETSDE